MDSTVPPQETAKAPRTLKPLSWLDRLLALNIFLAVRVTRRLTLDSSHSGQMVIGVLLGNFVPSTSRVLNATKFIDVSLPIAVRVHAIPGDKLISVKIGLLVMMWPILCRISFTSLRLVFRDRKIWIHLGFVRCQSRL